MPSPPPGYFVLLATLADPAAAELCAALLRSAGIESRLRGESLGPYRLTVGDLAATEVWVPASRVDEARELLAGEDLGEVEFAEPPDEEGEEPAGRPWSNPAVVGTVLLILLLLWALVARLS